MSQLRESTQIQFRETRVTHTIVNDDLSHAGRKGCQLSDTPHCRIRILLQVGVISQSTNVYSSLQPRDSFLNTQCPNSTRTPHSWHSRSSDSACLFLSRLQRDTTLKNEVTRICEWQSTSSEWCECNQVYSINSLDENHFPWLFHSNHRHSIRTHPDPFQWSAMQSGLVITHSFIPHSS